MIFNKPSKVKSIKSKTTKMTILILFLTVKTFKKDSQQVSSELYNAKTSKDSMAISKNRITVLLSGTEDAIIDIWTRTKSSYLKTLMNIRLQN